MKLLSTLTGLRYLAILAIASASSANPNCSAQVAQTPTAGMQTNETEGTSSFDQTTWSLPPRFQGDDPKRIVNRFSNVTKSEFETTAQFEQRKRSAAPSGDLVFVIRPAAFDTKTGWEAKYDADAQKLRIIVRFYGLRAG